MSTTPELILIMSSEIDNIIETMKDNHALPKDIEIEALSLCLFKSMEKLLSMGIYNKDTLEKHIVSILNKHFMDTGLDLYIKRYDSPTNTFKQIN